MNIREGSDAFRLEIFRSLSCPETLEIYPTFTVLCRQHVELTSGMMTNGQQRLVTGAEGRLSVPLTSCMPLSSAGPVAVVC